MNETIAQMTGASGYKKAPKLHFNKVEFQASAKKNSEVDAGNFKYTDLLSPREDGERAKVESLGSEIEIVFLKIKRDMFAYRKGEKNLQTSEHDNKEDVVALFGEPEIIRGKASELREQFQDLKVRQIIYAYLPSRQEVVKVYIKGTALYADDGRTAFYNYLQSFADNEHSHEFRTILKAVEVPNEDYWTIEFSKGEKLAGEQLAKIEGLIVDIHTKMKARDDFFASSNKDKEKVEGVDSKGDSLPTIEIDENQDEDVGQGINPEDIPF